MKINSDDIWEQNTEYKTTLSNKHFWDMHRHESNCKYDITILFYTVLFFGCWWYAGIRDDCQYNKTNRKIKNLKRMKGISTLF